MPSILLTVSDDFNSIDDRAVMMEVRATHFVPEYLGTGTNGSGQHTDRVLVRACSIRMAAWRVRRWSYQTRGYDVRIGGIRRAA